MPINGTWRERRLVICVLAALSMTIMLFTVVHMRHLLPSRPHKTENAQLEKLSMQQESGLIQQEFQIMEHAEELIDCAALFYADQIIDCINTREKLKNEKEMVKNLGRNNHVVRSEIDEKAGL